MQEKSYLQTFLQKNKEKIAKHVDLNNIKC